MVLFPSIAVYPRIQITEGSRRIRHGNPTYAEFSQVVTKTLYKETSFFEMVQPEDVTREKGIGFVEIDADLKVEEQRTEKLYVGKKKEDSCPTPTNCHSMSAS